jgi:hypothetical protein
MPAGANKAFQDAAFADGGGIHIKPSHKGLMHRDLGKAPDAPITSSDIAKEKAKGGAAKKRAVFAENAKKWHH